MALLDGYQKLGNVVCVLDAFLRKKHAAFFGADAIHPFLALKERKVIHDSVWGTFSYFWPELLLLDTPLLQRLRDIHQVGLAYQVYPSARHSRLEHSLGVLVMASRLFDALMERQGGTIRTAIRAVFGVEAGAEVDGRARQLKGELRLAALLHDVGHSVHSHASERVYSKLPMLSEAAGELSRFVGKKKGVGEVISFCFALTPCVRELWGRGRGKLLKPGGVAEVCEVDWENVALLIVGRSKHPFLQFLGDIISSDIDADKLDYLLRDSNSAGLPMRYDVDMYLNCAQVEEDILADGDGGLDDLYRACGSSSLERSESGLRCRCAHYVAYRLKLPKRAMHVVEQIVICKMMLFSYVYHHPKVRAAEGLLERMLRALVEEQRQGGKDDRAILEWFLEASDAHLVGLSSRQPRNGVELGAYRIVNRLLPREVMRFSTSEVTGAPKALLSKFMTTVRDKERGDEVVRRLEAALAAELVKQRDFAGLEPVQALLKAGAWLDVPKAPSFEDTQKVISGCNGSGGDGETAMFPLGAWQHAYTSYRWYVRIYAYSEYSRVVRDGAAVAVKAVMGIEDAGFFDRAERKRA